jgi:hypothetical protein
MCQGTERRSAGAADSTAASASAGVVAMGPEMATSMQRDCICYANALFMILAEMKAELEFKDPENNELWRKTVQAPTAADRSECVLQWIDVVSRSAKYPFNPKVQDDFDHFARSLAECTENSFSAVGGDLCNIVICGMLDVPDSHKTVGTIAHKGAHWFAWPRSPCDELVSEAMTDGAKVTVYCIAVAIDR